MGLVYGVGINDAKYPTKINKIKTSEYIHWSGMMARCFSENVHKNQSTYKGCSVSERFLSYSYFYEWCQSQIGFNDGWALDKDLLIKGNKIYSEDTCVFLPREINNTFLKRESCRSGLPIGVLFYKNKFRAQVGTSRNRLHLGVFDNIQDAFVAYKSEKEKIIKKLASKYRRVIDIRAYQSLINYSVDITD